MLPSVLMTLGFAASNADTPPSYGQAPAYHIMPDRLPYSVMPDRLQYHVMPDREPSLVMNKRV